MLKTSSPVSLAVASKGTANFDIGRPDFERLYSSNICVEECSRVLNAPGNIRTSFSCLIEEVSSLPQKVQDTLAPKIHKLEKALLVKAADFEEKVSLSAKDLREVLKLIDTTVLEGRDELVKKLNSLISEVDNARYLADLPKLVADGVFRQQTYYSPPGNLVESRKSLKQQPDLFDVIIIGGGPAGIAALGQLAREGVDTLMLEACRCVQSMSDARAKSVHTMRTNVEWSSLAGNGELACLDPQSTMESVMGMYPLRDEVEAARKYLEKSFAYTFDAEFASHSDHESPVARAEVFAYFHQLLAEAHTHENINVLEQSQFVLVRKIQTELFE